MSDLVSGMVAEKHRLLRERDKLDYQISTLGIAIGALQKIEEPEAPSPDAPPPQPEAAPVTEPPAAPIDRLLERIFPPYVTRPAAASTGKKPAPTKKGAAEPITHAALIERAAEWGIADVLSFTASELLAAVNEKAARIGHKPYALQSRSP